MSKSVHEHSLSVSEPTKERWRTAGRFADVLGSEIKERRKPFVARVVSWLNLCRLSQDLEEQMLLSQSRSPDDLQLHSALLSSAIANGENLLLECPEPEVLRPLGITAAGPSAKLESLRITQEQWHTEINTDRQAAVLREVFGGGS